MIIWFFNVFPSSCITRILLCSVIILVGHLHFILLVFNWTLALVEFIWVCTSYNDVWWVYWWAAWREPLFLYARAVDDISLEWKLWGIYSWVIIVWILVLVDRLISFCLLRYQSFIRTFEWDIMSINWLFDYHVKIEINLVDLLSLNLPCGLIGHLFLFSYYTLSLKLNFLSISCG